MSALLPPVDHISIGLSRLAEQYRGKPRVSLWVACFLQQVQYLEDAIHKTVDVWALDTAVGWRLDVLGDLVGQKRIGTTDEVYRLFIKARIRANRSLGKITDVRAIADILIGAKHYTIRELAGNVYVYSDLIVQGRAPEEIQAIKDLLQYTCRAGVRVWLVCSPAVPFEARGRSYPDSTLGGYPTRNTSTYAYGRYSAVRA